MADKLSVLRECLRVLRPAGKIAGYLIHTAPGLSPRERRRAAELGPTEVGAADDPAALAASVGFVAVRQLDATDSLLRICIALERARSRLEAELREAVGDEEFEAEQADARGLITGIEEGVLRRSLVLAQGPADRPS